METLAAKCMAQLTVGKFIVYSNSGWLCGEIGGGWRECKRIREAHEFNSKEEAEETIKKEFWADEMDWWVLQVAAEHIEEVLSSDVIGGYR